MRAHSGPGDLTDPSYWGERQQPIATEDDPLFRLTMGQFVPALTPHLREYQGQRFLELGASPGNVSAALCRQVPMQPYGVDFAAGAEKYLEVMRASGFPQAQLFRSDIRDFRPERPFDVVASFGLVEHFEDPQPILDEHVRLLRPGGLCIVTMPNFRGLPYAYHWLFDKPDLERHNVETMRPEVLLTFAERHRLMTERLGYVGSLSLWGVAESGGFVRVQLRRIVSRLCREGAVRLGRILPADHPWFAPWLIFVARKPN